MLGRGWVVQVMGMHFKLGLYEHQSAGALQGVMDLLAANPQLLERSDGGGIEQACARRFPMPSAGCFGTRLTHPG